MSLSKKEKDKLYKEFKEKIRKEEEQSKRNLEWQIRFEEEPRGNFQGKWRDHDDPGRDWNDH